LTRPSATGQLSQCWPSPKSATDMPT